MVEINPLTIWHKLLIYYLMEKNSIIKRLVNMDYIIDEDIEDIKGWSEEKVKIALKKIGTSTSDAVNCPWCTRYHKSKHGGFTCTGCGYGIRHGNCLGIYKDMPNYGKILNAVRATGRVSQESSIGDICTVHEIVELSREIYNTFKTLPNILP